MKPRRWYSSPELNPHPRPPRVRPFPAPIYWAYTTRTHTEQGAIIKTVPQANSAATERRGTTPPGSRPPRLIDAA